MSSSFLGWSRCLTSSVEVRLDANERAIRVTVSVTAPAAELPASSTSWAGLFGLLCVGASLREDRTNSACSCHDHVGRQLAIVWVLQKVAKNLGFADRSRDALPGDLFGDFVRLCHLLFPDALRRCPELTVILPDDPPRRMIKVNHHCSELVPLEREQVDTDQIAAWEATASVANPRGRCMLSNGLVTWKLDRLGRSLPHLLAIVTDLKGRGISFRSLNLADGPHHSAWRAAVPNLGAPAQCERVMAGLAAARPSTVVPRLPAGADASIQIVHD